MGVKNRKKWTILMYMVGNNELEPEIWQSKVDSEKVGSCDHINIVMQIGRASRELIRLIRPYETFTEEAGHWTGVRRYYINQSTSTLIDDLKNVNMADPRHLYDFIKWGIENYPSEHLMVILSGHGFSYCAAMTDLTQDAPYVMGVVQMCEVFNKIKQNCHVKTDVLVLDMCYMNTVEVLYELGKENNGSVATVLTYSHSAPLDGLPYDVLFNTLVHNSYNRDLLFLLETMINCIQLDLIAIKIDYLKLEQIKQIINTIAYKYLTSKESIDRSPSEIINVIDYKTPWSGDILHLQQKLKELVIHYKKNSNQNNDKIGIVVNKMNIASNKLAYAVFIYSNFAFCRSNYWLHLLTKTSIDDQLPYKHLELTKQLEPIILPAMCMNINISSMNPLLDMQEILIIYRNLITYTKWNIEDITNRIQEQLKNHLNRA